MIETVPAEELPVPEIIVVEEETEGADGSNNGAGVESSSFNEASESGSLTGTENNEQTAGSGSLAGTENNEQASGSDKTANGEGAPSTEHGGTEESKGSAAVGNAEEKTPKESTGNGQSLDDTPQLYEDYLKMNEAIDEYTQKQAQEEVDEMKKYFEQMNGGGQ